MKKSEIKVGGLYTAKISNKIVTVRVDRIGEVVKYSGTTYTGERRYRDATQYDVTNLSTGRKTTFKSAAKFRSAVAAQEFIDPAINAQRCQQIYDLVMTQNHRIRERIATKYPRTWQVVLTGRHGILDVSRFHSDRLQKMLQDLNEMLSTP